MWNPASPSTNPAFALSAKPPVFIAGQGSDLVDVYHTRNYLGAAADECRGSDAKSRRHRPEKQQGRMKRGDLEHVKADLEPFRNKKKDNSANASKKCHRYWRNRPGQFNDCSARAAALPKGSGAVESANRSVVQNRLKIRGAWWKQSGGVQGTLFITPFNGSIRNKAIIISLPEFKN